MQVRTVAQQLLFTTARITAHQGGETGVGTGFFFSIEHESRLGHATFLVTNKHVIEHPEIHSPTARMRVDLIRTVSGTTPAPAYGVASTAIWQRPTSEWFPHPDPAVDVAILPCERFIQRLNVAGRGPFFRAIDPSWVAEPAIITTLDAVEEVLFVGYPEGRFDATNLTPIARRGITATPVELDFDGLPAFLVDAAVFPGSSGSPVFLLSEVERFRRQSRTPLGLFLGLIAELTVYNAPGPPPATPGDSRIEIEMPSGLGLVFKASAVTDCIELARAAGAIGH